MKLYFISDIHGNEFALQAVLEHAVSISADRIYCAGDISGYFTGINEVIQLLKLYDVRSILGNHDAFLSNILSINRDKSYYPAFMKSCSILGADGLELIRNLPEMLSASADGTIIDMFHGGPEDLLNQYVFPDQINKDHFNNRVADLFVFGHTHLQFVAKIKNSFFLNPGSVGLPRNGDFRAHSISYDTESRSFETYRIVYKVDEMLRKYETDDSVNQKFYHNVLLGRSSNRVLRSERHLFFSAEIVENLTAEGFTIINTKFGAILSRNHFSALSNIIYVASYKDGVTEITSNVLYYNWQKKFFNADDSLKENVFKNDKAGVYYYEQYPDEDFLIKNIVGILKITFNKLEKYKYPNVTI